MERTVMAGWSIIALVVGQCILFLNYIPKLKGTARYAGLFLAPAEGFGPRPRNF